MGELVIKSHDFEIAKNSLKEFSQKEAKDLEIATVRTDGKIFGWGDHKVTGFELNRRLKAIQKHLIDLNTTNNRTIKEFGQIYHTFEVLDRDYIQAILISIKSTEKTSEGIKFAQAEIRKNVEDQKRTLEALVKFKKDMRNSLSNTQSSLENLRGELKSAQQDIEKALTFIESVSQYKHLKDVDVIWDKVEAHGVKLDALTEQIEKTVEAVQRNQDAIVELANYRKELSSINHLNDVDNLWTSNEDHSNEIMALQKQDEETRNLIQHNKDLVDQSLADEKLKADAVLQQLNKKIQYAYWIAGGSIALALIELLVILLG